MPNYNSFYQQFANQKLKWLPMDTETLYQENLKYKFDQLKKLGWIDADIDYDFNSHGFRCPEFTDRPTVMFLGCSHTIGIGLPYEVIWPTIVASKLGMDAANLGIGGSGPDTAFRMCLGYIDKINPKIVIHMLNPGLRFELVNDNRIDLLNWKLPEHLKTYHKMFADANNYFFNRQKNSLALGMLCAQRKIKFIEIDSKEILKFSEKSLARDLVHSGIKEHDSAAAVILDLINR